MPETEILRDYRQRSVRLTEERWRHVLEHPEMTGQLERVAETLLHPDLVVATILDPSVLAYHRRYSDTPVTDKHLVVVIKDTTDDAFVLTASFTSRPRRGTTTWPR